MIDQNKIVGRGLQLYIADSMNTKGIVDKVDITQYWQVAYSVFKAMEEAENTLEVNKDESNIFIRECDLNDEMIISFNNKKDREGFKRLLDSYVKTFANEIVNSLGRCNGTKKIM